MFTEVLLLSFGALSVIMAGVPIVSRLAEPAAWGPRYPVPERLRAAARPVETKRSFEPLDLGPDPVRWPSETQRADEGRPLPDWPSAHWDDPHFGAGAREARVEASHAQQQQRALERRAAPSTPAPQPAREPARGPRRAERPSFGLHTLFEASGDPDPLVTSADDLPSLDEIERLMAQHGLAGTVKAIMDATGMDFRDAAAHLARLRRR